MDSPIINDQGSDGRNSAKWEDLAGEEYRGKHEGVINTEERYQKAYSEAAGKIYDEMTPEEQESEQGRALRERIENRRVLLGITDSEEGENKVILDDAVELEKDMDKQERQADRSEKVEEKIEEVEIRDESTEKLLETAEGREKLNEGFYNELGILLQAIGKMYPDKKEMPEEVRRLSHEASFLQIYLDNGVTSHMHGAELTKDGYVVDKFHSQKYSEAMKKYRLLSEQCPDVFERMKNFEAEEISVDDYRERLRGANTAEEVMVVANEVMKAEKVADMETMYALRAFGSEINERLHEIDIEKHDTRKAELMEEQRGLEDLRRAMEDEYNSAGPIEKVIMNMRGYGRNKEDLSVRITEVERRIASLDGDGDYMSAIRYFEGKAQS